MAGTRIRASSIILVLFAALPLSAEEPPASAPKAEPPRKVITVCGRELPLMTREEVMALGFPWTDVPDEENASTYYVQGANILHELAEAAEKEKADLLDEQREHARLYGWDDSMKELADRIDAAEPALELFRKGSSQKLFQPPYHKTESVMGMLLPDLPKARAACRLLAAQARRFESQGKFKEAVENYLAAIRIGNHYGRGRCIIDQLVGIACIHIALNRAFSGFCRNEYPAEQLNALVAGLGSVRENLPEFTHAMRTEKVFGLQAVDVLAYNSPVFLKTALDLTKSLEDQQYLLPCEPVERRLSLVLLPDRTIRADMTACYDRLIDAARLPYHDPRGRISDDESLKQLKQWNILGHLLLPALGRARAEVERTRALTDTLRIAAALKLHKQRTGEYPDQLASLVEGGILDDLPADPFSGKPYLYKKTEGEFTVYSVGENMAGDVGTLPHFDQTDIGFTSKLELAKKYERPQDKPQEPDEPDDF